MGRSSHFSKTMRHTGVHTNAKHVWWYSVCHLELRALSMQLQPDIGHFLKQLTQAAQSTRCSGFVQTVSIILLPCPMPSP